MEQALNRACPAYLDVYEILWLAAGIVISAEAGNKENPDKPFAAVIVVVTTGIAAASV